LSLTESDRAGVSTTPAFLIWLWPKWVAGFDESDQAKIPPFGAINASLGERTVEDGARSMSSVRIFLDAGHMFPFCRPIVPPILRVSI